MPSEMFDNLHEDKKQQILHCAIKEFSLNEYEKASVTHIINDIKMSRGGFYYYFTSKKDLYFYLIERERIDFVSLLKSNYQEVNVFDLFVFLFDYIVSSKNSDKQLFFKKLIENMKPSTQKSVVLPLSEIDYNDDFIKGIDHLKVKSKEELIDFLIIMFSLVYNALNNYFYFNLDVQVARKRLLTNIDFIKYGVL
ncbi:MAG: TetR family transcriptional regulator [Haloplasmataceae bacterium]|jgi:AcrR family transcriptional regulator|nr:TetR family transcriptional regulator [Haloplasmataceae bacterium]